MKKLVLALLVCGTVFSQKLDFKKIKSFSTQGKQSHILQSGKEEVLYEKGGAGLLQHMFFAGGFKGIQETIIRIYVDGENTPSIEMEAGRGFNNGFNSTKTAYNTGSIIGKNGKKCGLYNSLQIPFGKGIKITAQNPKAKGIEKAWFWWVFRGTENIPLVLNGVELPKNARLKLHKVMNKTVKAYEEYNMCDTQKDGMLYMVFMEGTAIRKSLEGKEGVKPWHINAFMESCIRAYTDGGKEPTYLSSGQEDYFLGTYYYNTGKFANNMAGLTVFDKKNGKFSAYRIHERDPFFYQGGLRLTSKAGEVWFEKNNEKLHVCPDTVYSSYVWVYEW